tara:strand:- start:24836 stop:25267 length:432 start_codon:yes stop_codon:yes gene_type:complete
LALAEQYKAIGVSTSEFAQLSKKYSQNHDQAYLQQLFVYAKYRSTKQTIKSMFKYLCGVLNNKPLLEDLYTPNCLIKQKQTQHKLVEARAKQTDNVQQQSHADEFEQLSKKVEQYLSTCNESQRQTINQAFKQTAFVTGLTRL